MMNLTYDYDIAQDKECEYKFEIFVIRTGKVVDHADTHEEAIKKIESLELEELNG